MKHDAAKAVNIYGKMYELIQVGPQSYYIESPAKIGIYRRNDTDIYLVDSGNDKEAGKKILKIASQNNWTVKGIINTHSNADHIGGNNHIQKNTGCPVFANGIETAFTNYPILEPSFLYGGFPCKELRTKFLMAKESVATGFSSPGFPSELEPVALPGHFFDMTGIRVPDGTVFIADCVSSPQTLEKYGVTFIYDVAQYLATLDKIETMEAEVFVPSHAEVTKDIRPLAAANRAKVYEIREKIAGICTSPQTIDSIIQTIFKSYRLTMSMEQYVLVGSTIRSYLSWMKECGDIDFLTEDSALVWRTITSQAAMSSIHTDNNLI